MIPADCCNGWSRCPNDRKQTCADWYDGHADPEDGGGPYEERVLYTHKQAEPVVTGVDPVTGFPFKATLKFDPEPVSYKSAINADNDQSMTQAEPVAVQAEPVVVQKLEKLSPDDNLGNPSY